jgi:mRNA-degrading endonuclease YafQ of YafQ-DinJ toxin-antitoxin module
MSYFIFLKNSDNIENTLYKIAENVSDLNNLNITLSDYKIIEDSESNFNLVKFGKQYPEKYNNDIITYLDKTIVYGDRPNTIFKDKNDLQNYINNFKEKIQQFIKNNPNHPLLRRWSDYYDQLNSLDIDTIIYPLNNTLEQYFNDLKLQSLHPLQLP